MLFIRCHADSSAHGADFRISCDAAYRIRTTHSSLLVNLCPDHGTVNHFEPPGTSTRLFDFSSHDPFAWGLIPSHSAPLASTGRTEQSAPAANRSGNTNSRRRHAAVGVVLTLRRIARPGPAPHRAAPSRCTNCFQYHPTGAQSGAQAKFTKTAD